MDLSQLGEEGQQPRKESKRFALASFETATDRLRKQMELLDPLRSVRGAMARLEADSIQRYLRIQDESRQAMSKHMNVATELFQQYQATMASSLAERYAELTDSSAQQLHNRLARSSLERATQLPADMQRWMADLAAGQGFQQAAAVAAQWRGVSSESLRLFEQYRNPLARLATDELFERIAARARVFEQSQQAALAADVGHTQKLASASLAAQSIVLEAADAPNLQEALDAILAAIRDSRDTLIQRLLWFVLVPLVLLMIAAVVNPLADHYIKGSLSESSQGAEKKVKERAAQTVGDLSVLSDYRYVRAQALTVRTHPKASSPSVGRLRFGQAILVLEQRGAFTHVLWTSSDGTSQLKGWVFSRHLRKFE